MSRRKKRSPEEQARREKIRELLQSSGVSSMEDIQNLFKETIAEFMENGLDAELDDELGYSKYDYKNKDTDNSRNGHSSKTLRTSFGDVEVSVPRDRKGEFEPQILKKNQTSISQDTEPFTGHFLVVAMGLHRLLKIEKPDFLDFRRNPARPLRHLIFVILNKLPSYF